MKTQYRNMLWLAALPLAFAMGACQNEEIAEAGQSVNVEGKTVLRATMGSYNALQSRAQVELGNTDESQEFTIRKIRPFQVFLRFRDMMKRTPVPKLRLLAKAR